MRFRQSLKEFLGSLVTICGARCQQPDENLDHKRVIPKVFPEAEKFVDGRATLLRSEPKQET